MEFILNIDDFQALNSVNFLFTTCFRLNGLKRKKKGRFFFKLTFSQCVSILRVPQRLQGTREHGLKIIGNKGTKGK